MASKQCMPWLCSSIKVQKSFTSQYRWTWWTLLPKRLFSCRFLHFHAKFAVLSVAREARAVLRKALPLVPRPSPPSRASGTAGQVARCRENPPRGPPLTPAQPLPGRALSAAEPSLLQDQCHAARHCPGLPRLLLLLLLGEETSSPRAGWKFWSGKGKCEPVDSALLQNRCRLCSLGLRIFPRIFARA